MSRLAKLSFRTCLFMALGLVCTLTGHAVDAEKAEKPDPAGVEFFEKKVRPILVDHCFSCHSATAKKVKGGLLLDSREALLKGGDTGPGMVPGQPEKSRIIEAVRFKNVDLQMPLKGKLPDAMIADLTAWVKMGAPWSVGAGKANVVKNNFDLQQRKRDHWAWQPIQVKELPAVKDAKWPITGSDRFILSKLEEKGLKPTGAADRRTLIRRLYFDLIGLPPTPAELDAALRDETPDAYEKLVNRLLDSPKYGERWARHWLDLVRYAETRGHEFDYVTPNAYPYRDYMIRALNADVPYNQLVVEHVAGDLVDKPRLRAPDDSNESVLGTGFWFLGESVHSPVDTRQDEADRFDNMIDVFTKTFLGLTVSCARCHDHKFDAISTKDYYALFGFLNSSSYRQVRYETMEPNRRVAAQLEVLRDLHRPLLQRALAESLRPVTENLSQYLLGAREALLPKGNIEAIADARKLDRARLERWVALLKAALDHPNDPLHALAKTAVTDATDPKRLAEVLKPISYAWNKRDADAVKALDGFDVVLNYANPSAESWLPDGLAFGPAPAKPGSLRFGTDGSRPITRFHERAAAEKDSIWDRETVAPGTDNEPGAVGSLVRAGRMIRTPSFALKDNLWFLVKGNCQVYVAIDSHILVNGPLHGAVVQGVKAGKNFQWVRGPSLGAYQGHRVHIEFTATDGGDFSLAMVAQGANQPASVDRPNGAILQLVNKAETLDALVSGYQQLFDDFSKRLADDRLQGDADFANLGNWVLAHPELIGEKPFGPAGETFVAEQGKLIAQIKNQSHLALAMMDGSGEDERVFIRGTHKTLGDRVPRRFLEALTGTNPLGTAKGSGRLELAQQITDPTVNPFISRVIVNRIWHHLFGRGIVPSVDNFGVHGDRPTHPELLDYLADQFVKDGWSMKKMIRTLVLSQTYRMSAQPCTGDEADPQDEWLHRMRIRRLEGEAIRDAMLTVSGRFNDKMFGPPVPVHLSAFQDGRGKPAGGPLDGDGRRSIYISVRRNFISAMMLAFDTPIPFSTVGKRTVSNVPAQALILMNDPFVHQQADVWAKRIVAEGGSTEARITGMYASAFARQPTNSERTACVEFLDRQAKIYGKNADDPRAWTDLAHALFNVKEFIFIN